MVQVQHWLQLSYPYLSNSVYTKSAWCQQPTPSPLCLGILLSPACIIPWKLQPASKEYQSSLLLEHTHGAGSMDKRMTEH